MSGPAEEMNTQRRRCERLAWNRDKRRECRIPSRLHDTV